MRTSLSIQNSYGRLSKTAVHDSLIEKTIEFVWRSLGPWKKDPSRPYSELEEELNAQLHNFLQTRASEEFPMVFFQHEQRQDGQRKVDLSAKPVRTTIIQGKSYSIYNPIIVIEGKRLPAPAKAREREYVTGDPKISGGIQRFKMGMHGKDHESVIMIGYIQEKNPNYWIKQVNGWIDELSASESGAWNVLERLENFYVNEYGDCSMSKSIHMRGDNCKSGSIKINHFWIVMDLSI